MIENKEKTDQLDDFDNIYDDSNTDSQVILRNIRKVRILNIWSVRIFLTILLGFTVISLIIPLRPKYSETEKRDLTSFPKFTFSALFSGKYFDGINEWYSDTFPFRETFTEMNAYFSNLYGQNKVQIHGEVETGDEIPDVDSSSSEEESSEEESSSEESSSSESSSAPSESVAADESSAPATPPAPSTQVMGALLINGDTAYEYYNFVQHTADVYVAALNKASVMLDGRATVYDILVPNSMGIMAPDSLVAGINTSDQKKAIDYMFSRMIPNVKTVPIFDTLKSHKDQYIYFRTDHHWTALGAYYAYSNFMTQKGVVPTTLDSYITREFPGYLGSFYASSGKLPQLAANPDTVVAYQPTQTNLINIQAKTGAWFAADIISDMNPASASSKYLTFIKGDYPFSVINNPTLADNSACIVIKESYGNCFVPFLVAHYQNVYVVDYRYFSMVDPRGLNELRDATGATDVIFINNMSATRSKTLVAAIDAFIR